MNLHATARFLLTAFCAIQGIATIALDLNRTHAAHPQWLGHARFHVVWQTATVTALSALECALLWFRVPMEDQRFYLVAVLACLPIFGFFAALFSRHFYGGTLSDPRGILPLHLTIGRKQIQVDMNLAAEVAGLATVSIIVALYRAG